MNEIAVRPVIPAMDPVAIDKIRKLEEVALEQPQIDLPISQGIHAGVYSRTVKIPAGVMITGALIKVPTTLIFSGSAIIFIGDRTINLEGYYVLTAEAGRKQAFIAKKDTYLTMIFATESKTVEEAEREFTDEFEKLSTRA